MKEFNNPPGIEHFAEYFKDYKESYVIIGGSAGSLLSHERDDEVFFRVLGFRQ